MIDSHTAVDSPCGQPQVDGNGQPLPLDAINGNDAPNETAWFRRLAEHGHENAPERVVFCDILAIITRNIDIEISGFYVYPKDTAKKGFLIRTDGLYSTGHKPKRWSEIRKIAPVPAKHVIQVDAVVDTISIDCSRQH